jgi:alanyl-tRNA synthetase
LPIKCWYPSEEELPTVPYRRKKDLPWPVRIVEFPGYDICACCGTHPKTTGSIGLVKLFSCIKFHEGVRMEMACGKRALAMLNAAYEQNKQVSQAFSAKIGETGLAAQRMNEALAAEKFRANTLEKQLFTQIAQGYAGKTLALHFAKDLTPNSCRELCDAIADFAKIAVTVSGTDENGYCLCILSRTEDAKALGDAAAKALNGRGGGKKEAFQGRISATQGQIENFFTHNENL